jgi:hypothetical protein
MQAILELMQAMFEALSKGLVFGVPLTIAITTIVEAIKRRITLSGEWPRYIAVGLGTAFGGLWLLYGGEFGVPTVWWNFAIAFAVAFAWSFTSSEFYELLKNSSSRGVVKGVKEIEEKATLSLGEPPDQLAG